jgi:gas vesicle protein
MSDKGGGEFFAGFVIGALAGAAAALLLAPCSGNETRRQIQEKGIELKKRTEQLAEEARSQAQQAADDVRGQVGQFQERGRIVLVEGVKKAQQAVQEAEAKLGKPADTADLPA